MSVRGRIERDEGMQLLVDTAGGVSRLASLLGVKHQRAKWRRCPRAYLFRACRATGLKPEQVRPDLTDWITLERRREADERRARFAIARPIDVESAIGTTSALLELGVVMAAMRFAATERGQPIAALWKGDSREALSAKAYGMALAFVVGRVSATNIGEHLGCSRQNVDNAAERYQRARDGDDVEDLDAERLAKGEARVLERGRMRKAKDADAGLWAAETRFRALLDGTPPEMRKRA